MADPNPPPGPQTSAWSRGLWLGPLIAVPAFLSYYLFFARFPIFRDTAWLNIGLLLIASWLSIEGLRRAWGGGIAPRIAGLASLLVSGFLTGLLITYCYVLSYQLPGAELAADEGEPIPSLTLAANDGSPVDLARAAEQPLVLVVYRGHW